MIRPFFRLFFLSAFFGLFIFAAYGTDGILKNAYSALPSAGLYGIFEISVTNPKTYSNPFDFNQISLNTTFTSPSGKKINFFGFYDGDGNGGQTGNVWKFRFMPDEVGVWSYAYTWSDETAGGSGQFNVINSDLPGPLGVDPDNKYFFKFANGEQFNLRGYYYSEAFASSSWQNDLNNYFGPDSVWRFNFNSTLFWQAPLLKANNWNASSYGNFSNYNSSGDFYPIIRGDITRLDLKAWKHVDEVMKLMAQNKTLWYNFDGFIPNVGGDRPVNQTQEQILLYNWVARMAPYWNTTWNVAFEWGEFMSADQVNRIACYAKSLDPWNHMATVHNHGVGTEPSSTTCTTEHPKKVRNVLNTNWHDFYSIQYQAGNAGTASLGNNAVKIPAGKLIKPPFAQEVTWEGEEDSKLNPDQIRKGAWGVLTGAGGVNYAEQFKENGRFKFGDGGAFNYMKILSDALESFDFSRMVSRNDLVSNSAAGKAFALSEAGKQYLIYDEDGGDITVNLTGTAGDFNVLWLDPLTGIIFNSGTISGGSFKVLTTPFPSDSVLMLKEEFYGSVPTSTPSPSPTPALTSEPTPSPTSVPGTGGSANNIYYLSPDGSDSNPGSESSPWLTFSKAWQNLYPGDTLILLDGVYKQSLNPGKRNGQAGKPITVKAKNDGKAVIDGENVRIPVKIGDTWTGESGQNPVGHYFIIEGIVAKNSSSSVYEVVNGNNNIFRRVSGYNANTNENAHVFTIWANNNLLEDCAAGGTGRKMILLYQKGDNTVRRCYAQWEKWEGGNFCPGPWPWGEGIESYNSSNNIIENSIAFGRATNSLINVFAQSGATASSNQVLGSITARSGLGRDGSQLSNQCPSPYNSSCTTCADFSGNDALRSGFKMGNNDGSQVTSNIWKDILSVGNGGLGFYANISAPSGKNNQIIRATMADNGLGQPIYSGIAGQNMRPKELSNFDLVKDSDIKGTTYQGQGADLTKRYINGVMTNENLWPWPMEERIKNELGVSVTCEFGKLINQNTKTPITYIDPGKYCSGVVPIISTPAPTLTPTPTVNPTPTPTTSSSSIGGVNVFDVAAASGKPYQVIENGLKSGTDQYIDRGYTFSSVPTGLIGSTYLKTSNDDKASTADSFLTFDLNEDATVYVAHDRRITQKPSWLSSFTKIPEALISGGGTFDLYSKDYPAGKVSLGGNNGAGFSMYTVIIREKQDLLLSPTPTSSPSSAPSLTISPTPVQSTPTPTPVASGLTINSVTNNTSSYPNSKVPKYDKLEVSFDILNSKAKNFQLPFESSPPLGVELGLGITVNALFLPPGQADWSKAFIQPAFYYQKYQDQIKKSWDNKDHEWYYPEDSLWKVRFSPNKEGIWQYKITAQDISGKAESAVQSFTVEPSSSKGFVKVSSKDSRYFEFDDGSHFPVLGFAEGVNFDDPVLKNEANYQKYSQNNINLLRIWLSGLYGSAWPEWIGGRNIYDGYLPRAGLEPFRDTKTGKEVMTQRLDFDADGDTGWYDACRFQFWNDPEAVKPNTSYKLKVKYWGTGLAGPRVSGSPNFGLVAKLGNGWTPDCYEPNTGKVLTNYGGNTSDWGYLEGTWNSGDNNFLPRLYLGLENVTGGKVYVESISLKEDLGNGELGPEIIAEPSMQYETYYSDQQAYALDKVLELAEKYGVYLKMVLADKNDIIFSKLDDDGSFVINGEGDNQDGFYGLGREVNKTKWLHQAWWRYLQARWGYSPNIHSFELTNEGDPWLVKHYELTDELGKYMHCGVFGKAVGEGNGQKCGLNHPNDHLVTTSFWHSFPAEQFWKNSNYPNVDYADVHAYISTSNVGLPKTELEKMQWDSAYYHTGHSGELGGWNIGKPIIRGEAGIDAVGKQSEQADLAKDTKGIWLHKYLWSSVDPGALGELYWWTKNIFSQPGPDGNTGLYEVYGRFAEFMKGIPLNNGNYEDIAALSSNADIRAFGQKDPLSGKAHLWIDNKNHTWKNVIDGVQVAAASGTVSFSGMPSGTYLVTWYDPYTGNLVKTESLSASSGSISLSVSSLSSDTALKIEKQVQSITPIVPNDINITGLSAASEKNYQVVKGLVSGAIQYIDRNYKVEGIPEDFTRSLYIRTSNDDKNSSLGSSSFLSFNTDMDAVVYIAHDDRISKKPSWLLDFIDSGMDLKSPAGTFSLYKKDFPSGKITLGGNNTAASNETSMYTVIIKPKNL